MTASQKDILNKAREVFPNVAIIGVLTPDKLIIAIAFNAVRPMPPVVLQAPYTGDYKVAYDAKCFSDLDMKLIEELSEIEISRKKRCPLEVLTSEKYTGV